MTKMPLMLAAASLVLAGDPARGAEGDTPGRALYVQYCGACHGPEGRGDGIVATFLRPKPADLTQIAKKNGGAFPAQQTMEFIDGRKTMRAHGDPTMPVWGKVLSEEHSGSLHRRAVVRGILTLITDHLGSIQEK
jgi:mono/diheme cytochrome c family protein